MVIEIVLSSLNKNSDTILNCRLCPRAGLNGNDAFCSYVLMGMKPTHGHCLVNGQRQCNTLNLDEMYNCLRLKQVKFHL